LLASATWAAERQALRGHTVPAVTQLHLPPVGELASSTKLDLVIGLPLRNPEALTNLLQQQYVPTSPLYHHWLTPEEFTAKFGPTEQDYQAVMEFAKSNGFTITRTHPNRTLVDVRASVADIERTFRVTLHAYRHPTEAREFYAPDIDPSIDLTVPILHITGLDNYARPHPLSLRRPPANNAPDATPASGSGPSGSYMGYDFRSAYVPGVSLSGSGQVVGLVELDGYDANDITRYESQAGLADVPMQNVLLDGFSGAPSADALQVQEVSLDIEMAVSMAPGLTKVVVYEGPNNGVSSGDILNRIATDDVANQISCSWTIGDSPTFDQIYREYAAQGQSFFQASGDNGAYTSLWPDQQQADSPYTTVVGGTTLTTTGPEGSWQSEKVWNWNIGTGLGETNGASGGGISPNYPIPTWQQGVDMTFNQGSTYSRNVPDVAMVADGIYVIYDNGLTVKDIGGTSCAAPLWAGFMALVNQQAGANGQPTIGFINPAIYAIGTGTTYAACFHDITSGNNETYYSRSLYSALSRYDLCTGWGTPNGSGLINALTTCTYTIATSSTPSGGGSTSGGGTANCGSDVTVTATPSPCYSFVDWTENGVEVSASPNYTFTAVGNRTLVATFMPATEAVITTDSSPAEGGVTSGGGTVTCGTSVTVSAVPNEGYSFVNWSEGGPVVSTSSNYTFTATGDSTLVATFLCSSPIQPTSASYDATGGVGTVTVANPLGCIWAANSGVYWITIQSVASGTVNYAVAANQVTSARAGTMTIAGQTFTVDQAGRSDCLFALNRASITLPAKGGTKTVKVKSLGTPCDWTAVSNDPFITITEGTNGAGSGIVRYTVPGNTNTALLMGTMTIAGQTFTVNQAVGGCTFSLSPKSAKYKAVGGSKTVKVKANFTDCAWTAVSNDSFITITDGTNGVGKGTVSYTVAGNTNNTPLTGSIIIAGKTFTITQAGAP
jgi:subtilase family serine protease